MSGVKSWSMIICFTSVLCTIIEVLVPSGKMEKMFRLVLGAFMLCAILIPLKTTVDNINFDTKKNENITSDKSKLKSTIENQTKENAKKKIKSMIEEILLSQNIKAEKINIIMDTKQDNCISIKKIEVFLARGDEDKKDMIKEMLLKKLELKIDVVVGSG